MIHILLAAVIVGLVVVAGFLLYVRNTHKTKIEAAAAIATKAEAAAAYASAEVAAVKAKIEAAKVQQVQQPPAAGR